MTKLLAVNVFQDGNSSDQQTTPTNQNQNSNSTTPKTNDNTQNATQQSSTTQQTAKDATPTKDAGSNLFIMGSVFAGFLILVLLMLIIIQKLNRRKSQP